MIAPRPSPVAPTSRNASTPNSRAAAASLIAQWLETEDFPDRMLEAVSSDRAFLMEVVYGVVRHHRSLVWILDAYMDHPPEPAVRACLLVGAYQLVFMDNVPAHAAVNECVEAARAVGGPRVTGFVNSVLRRVAEQAGTIRTSLAKQPLGVRASFPDALLTRWTSHFGPARTEALCLWHNTRPRTVLRVDRRRTSVPDLLARLRAAGMAGEPHSFRPEHCITLSTGTAIPDVPGYAEGFWMAQDPATLRAVELLAPQPGDRVLDACAAPGGKAMCIAEALDGKGELVALDLHADRMEPLRQNAARMRAPLRIVQADARDPALPAHVGAQPFDRILADVPCTNTGVLRRRPDARWRFTVARLNALRRIQAAILDNLARLLKPGGAMVYSTCSLEPEENERVIRGWLAQHPEFRQVRSEFLFPPESQTDGAFAALLKKS
ncbi:MAG: 16S rRNA (cytosine(967)-C(5))-methyltransferase RsmB [Verrucomicrobia bacterium]|nr:16S rRNA (cytosine(967)-C(5))-methyltransferase RsmB [Verrucomicrobiota bacterium]